MEPPGVPSALVIRRATEQDIPAALDHLEAVAAEGRWIGTELPLDREQRALRWRDSYSRSDAATFLAYLDGILVGMASVQGRGVAHLGMSVIATQRRKGIGSRLLETAIAWARAQGAHKVALEVWPHNAAAIALYERFGFEREGYLHSHYKRRNGELWDSLIMGLLLSEGAARRSP